MNLQLGLGKLRALANAIARRLENSPPTDGDETIAVAPLQETITAIRRSLLERYRLPSSSDSPVTHYTRLSVVQAILDAAASKSPAAGLRRYSSSRFNDPTEGTLLLNALRERSSTCFALDDPRPAYIASFVAPANGTHDNSREPTFDNLRYWRYYGDDGAGCSLHVPVPRHRLHRVLYGDEYLEQTVADLAGLCDALSRVLNASSHLPPVYRFTIRDRLTRPIVDLIGTVRFLHKASPYRDENECRVLGSETEGRDSLHFDVSNTEGPIPDIRSYRVDSDLAAKEILVTGAVITVGPCVPHAEDIRAYFEHLLEEAALPGPVVRISEVRYRTP